MKRFFRTVGLGTLIYVVAGAFSPSEGGLYAVTLPFAGAIYTGLFVLIFLCPLRAVLRGFLPKQSDRTHAFFLIGIFITLLTVLSFRSAFRGHTGQRVVGWVIWSFYIVVVVNSFYWPLATYTKREPEEGEE